MAVELNQLIQNLETYVFILNTKTVNYNEFINSINIINDIYAIMCKHYQFITNTNAMDDESDGNQSILDYLNRIQKYSENYLKEVFT